METKFSLYLTILKNALMSLFLLMSNGDVSVASSAVTDKAAPVASNSTNKDGKAIAADKTVPPVATAKGETVALTERAADPAIEKKVTADKKTAVPTDAAAVVDPTKKTAVSTDATVVVDATKKATAPTDVTVVVDATKKTTAPTDVTVVVDATKKTTAPTDVTVVVDATKKATAPTDATVVVDATKKTTAPTDTAVIDTTKKATVPITDASVVVDVTKKVGDKTATATGANVVVDATKKAAEATLDKASAIAVVETKKDVPAPVPGSQEALKADLLAELKVVLRKQVDETVSAKMANSNASVSVTAGGADTKSTAVGDIKNGKKPAEVSGTTLGNKTPCNMLTATTCGENSACGLRNKFCHTNCAAIADEGACMAASDCEWGGAFKKSCDFKK